MSRPTTTRRGLGTPALVVVLIVALVSASLVRSYTMARRADTGATVAAGKLDSFALGLLLGGLRGPLVMTLWASTERQKTSRDLRDFETKVELIRLLQPEYDSVHLYQIWNKAYNASATVANLPSKYEAVLEAVRYAQEVDADRPDNVNITTAIGETIFQKLGKVTVPAYLKVRAQAETRAEAERLKVTFPEAKLDEVEAAARAAGLPATRLYPQPSTTDTLAAVVPAEVGRRMRPALEAGDVTFAKAAVRGDELRMPVLLDEAGDLLPEADLPDAALERLREFGPFPQGVPASAVAWAYFSDGLRLQEELQQRHRQLSPRVLSRNPAFAMQQWAEQLFYDGRLFELEGLGVPLPGQVQEYGLATANLPATPVEPRPLLADAVWAYSEASTIYAQALVEFDRHLERFPSDLRRYEQRIAFCRAMEQFMRADAAYLLLVQTEGEGDEAERGRLAAVAAEGYAQASVGFSKVVARHFTTPDLLAQVGLIVEGIPADQLPTAEAVRAATLSVTTARQSAPGTYEYEIEASEFGVFIARSNDRLAQLAEADLLDDAR